MHAAARQLRPLFQVGLPVAVAVVLVCLAVLNMALVKTWPGEADDGVLWQSSGPNTPVIAADVAKGSAGARAGIQKRDELLLLNNQDVTSPKQVEAALHDLGGGPGPLGLETVDNSLDARAAHVTHQFSGKVHPLHQ